MLLYVGRLSRSKNVQLTIDTLAGLRDARPWRFDIVGSGDDMARLKERSRAAGLENRIHFHGHQEHVDRFYSSADLLVFPSRLESAGLVVLEAMGHGVPALVVKSDGKTYRTASPEFIDHAVDGYVAQDESDYSRMLRQLIAEPAGLAAAGRAARRKVAAKHDWVHHAGLWNDELLRLSSSVPRSGAA
jgi:glycosyltransferase involved in cell wall biosynthesis